MSAVPYEELNLGGAVGDDPAAVRANRERAARSLGLDPARVVWMNQVHGRDVAVVDGPWGDGPDDPRGGRGGDRAARTRRSRCSPPTARRCCSPTRSPGSSARGPRRPARSGRRSRAGRGRGHGRARRGTVPDHRAHRTGRLRTVLRGAGRRCAPRSPRPSRRRGPRPAGGHRRVDVTAGVHAQLAELGVGDLHSSPVLHPGIGRPLLVPPRPHHRAARRICLVGLIGHDGPQGSNSRRTWHRWRNASLPPAPRPAASGRK